MRRSVYATALTVAWLAASTVAGGAQTSHRLLDASPFAERLHFFRFLEDYGDVTDADRARDWFAALKRIPLGADQSYLSVGGDYRFRVEHFDNALFGLFPAIDYAQTLHRFMVHADLHAGPNIRVFAQMSAFTEAGHPAGPGPFDQSSPDVQQVFVDLGTKDVMLRLGRQEIVLGSGKLTDIREGPNQRQSFDAARLMLRDGDRGFDLFLGRDVIPDKGAFADSSADGTAFWGAYAAGLVKPWRSAALDIYYFGIDRNDAVYQAGIDRELRHSLGARLAGTAGAFSYEYEGIYQFGTFGTLDIDAWGVRTEHYYTFEQLPLRPRLGLIANATSGDEDAADGKLGTFDALFPNPAYTTDASIFRPRNFYELHPVLSLDVTRSFNLMFEANFLWRVETTDAVYAVPGFALVASGASNERYIGAVYDAIATWRVSPHLTLQASYVHAQPGAMVKDAGGRAIDFMLLQSMFRF